MPLRAEYIKDLPMIMGTRLSKRGRPEHWLHPIHGPLPDLIGLVAWSVNEFICAVWPLTSSFIVMLECSKEKCAHFSRGGILQSYRWIVRGSKLVHVDQRLTSEGIHIGQISEGTEESTRRHIYRQLMIESVTLAVHTSIGGFFNGAR